MTCLAAGSAWTRTVRHWRSRRSLNRVIRSESTGKRPTTTALNPERCMSLRTPQQCGVNMPMLRPTTQMTAIFSDNRLRLATMEIRWPLVAFLKMVNPPASTAILPIIRNYPLVRRTCTDHGKTIRTKPSSRGNRHGCGDSQCLWWRRW